MSRADIEAGIDRGVQRLIDSQTDDGHWPYTPGGNAEAYPVGHTALAVLALQHARSKRADAHLAIKKGMKTIEETATPNAVTSILADYRGYDTLGETSVIFTAGISCILILRRRKQGK